jgi:hypothetical protein
MLAKNSQNTILRFDMLSSLKRLVGNQGHIDVKDKIFIATLLTYVVGFLITNIYLGSLGIARLEILRVKYVTTAFLFAAYYMSIIIPFEGFRSILFKSERIDFRTTGRLLWHTFESFLVVMLGTSVLAIIGGSQQLMKQPDIRSSSTQSLAEAAHPLALQLLQFVAAVGVICIGLFVAIYCIAFFAFLVRRELSKFWEMCSRERLFSLLQGIITVCVVPMLLLIPFGVFGLSFSGMIPLLPVLSVPDGWDRFLKTAFGFYALGGGLLYIIIAQKESISGKRHDDGDDWAKAIDPNIEEMRSVVFRAMIFFLILGMYAVHVYPALPQQIGGGREILVRVITSKESVAHLFDEASNTYLVDRSDHSTVFRVTSHSLPETSMIVEVSNEHIDSIEYNPLTSRAKP